MISTPSSMPHQSSHVRWVPKSRKSDIVDLLLKKAYVSSRRASLRCSRDQAGRIGAYDSPRRGNQFGSCKSDSEQSCSALIRNDSQDDMTATVNDNKTE